MAINRSELEARLARIVGRINKQALSKIIETLGDPPRPEKLNGEFWKDIQLMYSQPLFPELETIFHDAAESMISTVGAGVEWDIVNKRAADWARTYTYDLVTKLTANSQAATQNAISDFYTNRLDLGGLQDRLARVFSPVRAEMIAITETTRAAAQGEAAYIDELRKQGAVMVAIWVSENDSSVCSLCAPLDGKKQGDGWQDLPPRHVRCRCGVRYEAVIPD